MCLCVCRGGGRVSVKFSQICPFLYFLGPFKKLAFNQLNPDTLSPTQVSSQKFNLAILLNKKVYYIWTLSGRGGGPTNYVPFGGDFVI